MRGFLRRVGGNWHTSFGHDEVSYTPSLRTRHGKEAEVRIAPIRDTVYRRGNGTLAMPAADLSSGLDIGRRA